jgi:hypothetical protein
MQKGVFMRSRTFCRTAVLAIAMALGGQALAQSPLQTQYEGTISDHVQALGTTWAVSGEWSIQLDGKSGTGNFSASLSMFDTANPAAVPHTHHVTLADGEVVVSEDWSETTTRFTLSGLGHITGNGNASYVDAPIEVTITGGNAVTYSNIRLKLGGSAEGHFGTAPLGGAVTTHR